MSNNTILGALDRMGYKGKMTGHGFRGVGFARTVANITTTTESILRSLIRAKRVESKAGLIRVLRRQA